MNRRTMRGDIIPIWPILEHYGWDLPRERESWQPIHCAVHNDRHRSAGVTTRDGGRVHCLACGFSASAVGVVRHYEQGLSVGEAIEFARGIVGDSGAGVSDGTSSERYGSNLFEKSGSGRSSGKYVPPRSRNADSGF